MGGNSTARHACRVWRYLRALSRLQQNKPELVLAMIVPLLDEEPWRPLAVEPVSRSALMLARAGRPGGLKGLAAIRGAYGSAGWSHANYALALRLLGEYDAAARAYAGLLAAVGRKAWALNELALLEHARGRSQRALDLLFEGARDDSDASGQDTCRGNAAMLLLLRGRPSDRVPAAVLLERAVKRDPTRVRSRYWLEQLRRGGRLPDGGRYARVTLERAAGTRGGEPAKR